jgi:hypothetical protein
MEGDEMGWARSMYGSEKKYIKRIGLDPQGKRPYGRPSCRW